MKEVNVPICHGWGTPPKVPILGGWDLHALLELGCYVQGG